MVINLMFLDSISLSIWFHYFSFQHIISGCVKYFFLIIKCSLCVLFFYVHIKACKTDLPGIFVYFRIYSEK